MFNKKIIASALIGSLAFTLFPTNIFANSNQLTIEKKICENIDELKDFNIYNNNFYYKLDDNRFVNLNNEDYNLFDLLRKYIKNNNINFYNYNFSITNPDLENTALNFIKILNNDLYFYNNNNSINEIYKNNEKIAEVPYSYSRPFAKTITVDNNGNIYYVGNYEKIEEINEYYVKSKAEIYKISNGKVEKIKEYNNLKEKIKDIQGSGYEGNVIEIFSLNNDIYLVKHEIFGNFEIEKNGKPLCENLENNSGNTGNTNNGNSTIVSGGSPVNVKDLEIKKDPRVLDQNNSSNSTKTEETKKEEIDKKIEELNGILENYNELMPHVIGHENSFGHYNWDLDGKSKHYISFKIQNILEKNSYNIIRNIYKNSSKEKIKKLASENNFISYYLEEYKKQFEELELKIDSYTYNLPIEVIKKIKTRIKTFFEKYDNLDYLVRIYKVLKSDPKIQKQAETSKEVYYIINIYNVNLVYDIINEDIQKNYDINLDIEEIRKKQEENFQKYKANLKN